MAIPVILKGDTSTRITFTLSPDYPYEGCALRVDFHDVSSMIYDLEPGGTVFVQYTAEETSRFPLGTGLLILSLVNEAGVRRTLPVSRVKVTDAPGEVYDEPIFIDPSQLDVADATAADSLGAVKEKLNSILAFLRGGFAALAACLFLTGAGVQTAALNDIPGDAQVVTNVSGLVTAPAVTNIARAVVEGEISPDNAAFSNAVLGVGIGVDTNAVAALNALLDGEGDALPVGGATTVGGLLVALAAALAALKKKVDGINLDPYAKSEDVIPRYGSVDAAIADGTLTLTPYSRNALTSDGTAFTVLMGGEVGVLRDCVFVVTAGDTAPTISWGEEDGQTFNPRTDAATDMEIAANTTKVFWVTEYAPDCFAVAGWEVPSVSE